MVSRALRFSLFTAIFATAFLFHLSAKELMDYHVGDTIEADVIAPEKFIVADVSASAAARQRAAALLPMVARYYPAVVNEAENEMRKEFINARNNFLNVVETQFHRRMPDPETPAEFLRLAVQWPGLDKSFPLTTNLAALWTRGQSDEPFLNSLADHLRSAQKQFIFPAAVPDGWHTGDAVRLVALTNLNIVPTPAMVETTGFTVARSNIVSFTRARVKFRETFPEEQHPWAEFLQRFLKENCAPDMKLTEAVRAANMASIQLGDTYQAGQIVVRRGETVNAKMLAAIARVRELRAEQKPATKLNPPAPPQNQPMPAIASNDNRWLWLALGIVSLVAVGALWQLRRRPAISQVPARVDSGAPSLASVPTSVVNSKEFQESVAPHLARFMTDELVRKLVSERANLMLVQQQVAAEIADLEVRLEQINAPLQDRLSAYEQRIAELEKQLADRDEQNRELIKAKIEGVKQQLVNERLKSQVKFN